MDINEVINLVQQTFGNRLTRDDVRVAIEVGFELPVSKEKLRLEAHGSAGNYEVDDDQLDRFFARFEEEKPGRYIPTPVRRLLLIEAGYACGRCRNQGPIEFHHIVEFHRIGHHDALHMIALCPTCHTMCGNGTIDRKAQEVFKSRLQNPSLGGDVAEIIQYTWDDLRDVVESIHSTIVDEPGGEGSSYDFTLIDLDIKDKINSIGPKYMAIIRGQHLPYFNDIKRFLGNPANREIQDMYQEVVEEIRTRLAVEVDQLPTAFERVLMEVRDQVLKREPGRLRGRTIAVLS